MTESPETVLLMTLTRYRLWPMPHEAPTTAGPPTPPAIDWYREVSDHEQLVLQVRATARTWDGHDRWWSPTPLARGVAPGGFAIERLRTLVATPAHLLYQARCAGPGHPVLGTLVAVIPEAEVPPEFWPRPREDDEDGDAEDETPWARAATAFERLQEQTPDDDSLPGLPELDIPDRVTRCGIALILGEINRLAMDRRFPESLGLEARDILQTVRDGRHEPQLNRILRRALGDQP